MKKNIIIFLSLMCIVTGVFAANNYTWEYSSVDDGEVRWWGSTTYSTQLSNAMTTWNNYWHTDFKPDSILTFEDLTIMDINSSSSLYYWKYSYYGALFASDELRVNTHSNWMWGLSNAQRENMLAHELGHSLWLTHSYANNVMLWGGTVETRTSLGTQDKSSYDTKWN